MSKLNYLLFGNLYPMLGKSLECKHGEKTVWYGKVLLDRTTGKFTGQCDTEEEADKAAQDLLRRLNEKVKINASV